MNAGSTVWEEGSSAMVIGGGVAGTVAALALTRAGIRAHIYEAHPAMAHGAGGYLSLAPNGFDALKAIGADEVVGAWGLPVPTTIMVDGAGTMLSTVAGVDGVPPTLVLTRAQLLGSLVEHVMSRGIPYSLGKRLIGVTETEAGVVAHFADGTVAHGDVLIGADGIRSTVRTVIDAAAPGPVYAGALSFAGIAANSCAHAEPGAMHVTRGSVALDYWGFPDGCVGWLATLPSPSPMSAEEVAETSPARWLSRLRAHYADHCPGADLIARTDPVGLMAVGALERLPAVPRWYRGRMVLLGDAAHAPSPDSGQGAALAIESAVELARCLRDLPPAAAFPAYEACRRERVESVADLVDVTDRAAVGHHIDWEAPVAAVQRTG